MFAKGDGKGGLKKRTKPGSVAVRLSKGGKAFVVDNSKKRIYKVKGE